MQRFFLNMLFIAMMVVFASTSDLKPNWDSFADDFVASTTSSKKSGGAGSSSNPFTHYENSLDVPTFQLLNNKDNSVSRKRTSASSSPEDIARAALSAEIQTYKLKYGDLSTIVLDHVHDTGFGPIIVVFKQELNGLEVVNLRMKVTLSRPQLTPVVISGYVTSPANSKLEEFRQSPTQAVLRGLKDLTNIDAKDEDLKPLSGKDEDTWSVEVKQLSKPVRVEKVIYFTGRDVLPAYYLEIHFTPTASSPSYLYSEIISAVDGKLLNRRSRTHTSGGVFAYRLWADDTSPYTPYDGPQGNRLNPYPSFSIDTNITINYVPSKLVHLSNAPFSLNDPWLLDDANTTNGNNAIVSALNHPPTLEVGWSPIIINRTLNCTFNPTLDAEANEDQYCGAVTSVFYVLNWLHDWFYDVGFTEAAGNGQVNNYGRGGVEGDPVIGFLHDPSDTYNAYITTPKDGRSPMMVMYLWPYEDSARGTLVNTTYDFILESTSNGPVNIEVTAEVVFVDGCQPITNNVTGKIAMMYLAGCEVANKTENAAAAGAVAVMVIMDGSIVNFFAPYSANILMVGVDPDDINRLIMEQESNNVPLILRIVRKLLRYDGAVDNMIVAHEWGHYMTDRLGNLDTTQSQAMGEGWSDFIALLMTVREEDSHSPWNSNWNGVYVMSAYTTQAYVKNSAYYGIRRLPYTTNMTINPLTFKHISNGIPLPPPLEKLDTSSNAEVHNAGEIWANVLWECYASLLRDTLGNNARLTFSEAQLRMKSYLVAGLKIMPSNPTYLEARDSLLMATYQSDATDFRLFCDAFAKRGMGTGAIGPVRFSQTFEAITENYYCGILLKVINSTLTDDIVTCDNDGVLDRGETGTLKVTVENLSIINLTDTQVTMHVNSSEPNLIFVGSNVRVIGSLQAISTVDLFFTVSLSTDANKNQRYEPIINISFTNTNEVLTQGKVIQFSMNYDFKKKISTRDDILSVNSTYWIADKILNQPGWQTIDGSEIGQNGDVFWWGHDLEYRTDISLTSPDLNVSTTADFIIQFDHLYAFEVDASEELTDVPSDGGVLELYSYQTDNWVDLMPNISSNYSSLRSVDYNGNPLAGRVSYTGISTNYPIPQTEIVNLGRDFAGQTVKFRFRIGTNPFGGSNGWFIKYIQFNGIDNTPFDAFVAQTCTPPMPSTQPPTTSQPPSTMITPSCTQTVININFAGMFIR